MHKQGSSLYFYSGKIGDELFKRGRGGGGDGYLENPCILFILFLVNLLRYDRQ